jgi:hypothetical protein
MSRKLSLVALSLALSTACQTTRPSAGSALRDDATAPADSGIPPLDCGADESTSFMLKALDAPPAAGVVSFPGNSFDVQIQAPNEDNALRLDGCLSATTSAFALKRIVFSQNAEPQIYKITSTSVVRGLDAALAGDHASLELYAANDDGESGVIVKGWRDGSRTFATVVTGKPSAQGYQLYSIYVFAGTLVVGDPLANRRCGPGEIFLQSQSRLGDLRMGWEVCTFLGGGETTGYRALRVTLDDPALDHQVVLEGSALRPIQGFPYQLPSDSEAPFIAYTWHHHNACDSFYLKLPEAAYAATTAASAGCAAALPNAPARTFEDQSRTVKYRVKHGDAPWQDAATPEGGCAHYLFCSQPEPTP